MGIHYFFKKKKSEHEFGFVCYEGKYFFFVNISNLFSTVWKVSKKRNLGERREYNKHKISLMKLIFFTLLFNKVIFPLKTIFPKENIPQNFVQPDMKKCFPSISNTLERKLSGFNSVKDYNQHIEKKR